MTTLIIHSPEVAPTLLERLNSEFNSVPTINEHSTRYEVSRNVDLPSLRAIMPHDVNVLPKNFVPEKVKLVISDMDSTLINIECIDEIADMAGLKDQVSAITEAAMRGQLDFSESLTKRVALLKGLPSDTLLQVYEQRLSLNPGGELLLRKLQANSIRFSLVSGGFHFFTDRLMEKYGFQDTLANNLEVIDHKLTGKIEGPIIDATAKADYLIRHCRELSISPVNVVAMGDGANDLEMLAAAGMGVAYHAKPAVQQQADCALNDSGLDGLLTLLNIPH